MRTTIYIYDTSSERWYRFLPVSYAKICFEEAANNGAGSDVADDEGYETIEWAQIASWPEFPDYAIYLETRMKGKDSFAVYCPVTAFEQQMITLIRHKYAFEQSTRVRCFILC